MKVTVIGGGSTYTPELVNGFLNRIKTFPLTELWLMDILPGRLETVGGFARRMVEARGSPFEVILSTNQREAISGASYIITQLRVGMMAARRSDEYLGKRYGLIGQETTGVGGMAKALRTIPVILRIASDMHEVAPNALLVNFTNPAGLITEALTRHAPNVPAVGVCNVGITTKMELIHGLEDRLKTTISPDRTQLDTLGLNHLTWHRGFTLDGEDLWSQIFDAYLDEQRASREPEWDIHLLESLQMIPNYYLQYYYYTDRKLASQDQWPPSRAEQVMDIENDLLKLYTDPNLTTPPQELMKRGGAYYSTLATQLLDSHYNDLGQVHIVNVRNNGAVPEWPSDWVLEIPSKVNRNEIKPLSAKPLPHVSAGLVAQVKAYELLTVEAAVNGDRNAGYQALITHPLGPKVAQAKAVLDDMLQTNRALLPQFWRK
jgi:6-phospho-beta-glucosidase